MLSLQQLQGQRSLLEEVAFHAGLFVRNRVEFQKALDSQSLPVCLFVGMLTNSIKDYVQLWLRLVEERAGIFSMEENKRVAWPKLLYFSRCYWQEEITCWAVLV